MLHFSDNSDQWKHYVLINPIKNKRNNHLWFRQKKTTIYGSMTTRIGNGYYYEG